MSNEPIFVVGVSRSGTTLLASMLGAHARISCGPETHVFASLKPLARRSYSSWRLKRRFKRGWPDSAVDMLRSITHLEARVMDNYGVSGRDVRGYMEGRSAQLATVAAALPDLHRARQGKARWAEKTPGHLTHVGTIRRLFPKAPVVRIVRDPRDVAVSLVQMPWGPATVGQAADLWLKHDGASADFFDSDSASVTVRFEDLVCQPTETMQSVCAFIGESFEPDMLNTAQSAAEVNKADETWKEKVGEPLDVSRIGAWRTALTREQQRIVEAITGGRMKELGYDIDNHFLYHCDIYPRSRVIDDDLASALAEQQLRIWKVRADEPAKLRMFLGNPDGAKWFSGGRLQRVLALSRIVVSLVRARVNGTPVRWIHNVDDRVEPSTCARIAARFVSMMTTSSKQGDFSEYG